MPCTYHSWTLGICLTKFIWRRTRSEQVTRTHSLYTATGWWGSECWNNEILIKCRKLVGSRECSRAGWEQGPVQQLLCCCGKVQCGCEPMVFVVSVTQLQYRCSGVLLGFPHTGLCCPLNVLLHKLPLLPIFDFHILSLPLPSSQLGSENNWGWTLAFFEEYLLYICGYFLWELWKKKRRKNETSSPGPGSVFRVKAGHEKGHFPFLSNWLWFLRSITLECSPEMPIFL